MSQPRRDPGWLRHWWPLYLVLVALAFAIPETVGVVSSGEGGTLTEMTQEWLGVDEGATTVGWVVLTVLIAGFAVWFPIHLRSGWWWEKKRRDDVDGG